MKNPFAIPIYYFQGIGDNNYPHSTTAVLDRANRIHVHKAHAEMSVQDHHDNIHCGYRDLSYRNSEDHLGEAFQNGWAAADQCCIGLFFAKMIDDSG